MPTIVIPQAWLSAYNSLVLTMLLVTQIYLDVAIFLSQRRQRKEAKKAISQLHGNDFSKPHSDSGPSSTDTTLEK